MWIQGCLFCMNIPCALILMILILLISCITIPDSARWFNHPQIFDTCACTVLWSAAGGKTKPFYFLPDRPPKQIWHRTLFLSGIKCQKSHLCTLSTVQGSTLACQRKYEGRWLSSSVGGGENQFGRKASLSLEASVGGKGRWGSPSHKTHSGERHCVFREGFGFLTHYDEMIKIQKSRSVKDGIVVLS